MRPIEVEKKTFDKVQVALWIGATVITGWLLYAGYFKGESPEKPEAESFQQYQEYDYPPAPTLTDTVRLRAFNRDNYSPNYAEAYPSPSPVVSPPDRLDKIITLVEVLGALILNLSALLIPLITMWMQRKNFGIQTRDPNPGHP